MKMPPTSSGIRFKNWDDADEFALTGNREKCLKRGDKGWAKAPVAMSYTWHPKAIKFIRKSK